MGFIYKVTNTVNGKIYIGQTCRDVRTRWREHVQDAFSSKRKHKFAFHRAIQKYGEDAFAIEILEECDKCVLDDRERYWIKHYGSYGNGYNADLGGRSNRGHPIYQYSLDGTFIREFDSVGEAQASIGGKVVMISTIRANTSNGGYLWRRYKVEKLDVSNRRIHQKQVHQYTPSGEYIATFDSLTHAAQSVRGRYSGALIGAVCRGDRQYAYGYRWSFTKEEHLHDPKPPKHLKKVVRISPDTGEEKVYNTIVEAAADVGACPPNITEACKGRTRTCKGFFWRYYDNVSQNAV